MENNNNSSSTTPQKKKKKKTSSTNKEVEEKEVEIVDLEKSQFDLPNIMANTMKNIPNMPTSPSFYANLYESAKKSPMAAVSSVMALFMVVIAALVVTALFTPCKAYSNSHNSSL